MQAVEQFGLALLADHQLPVLAPPMSITSRLPSPAEVQETPS